MITNIFIVEDHEFIREMLGEFLTVEPDFDVCGMAGSGEEALKVVADTNVELMLIDTSLPGMSGIDLVREINDRRPALRCLMHSGHGEASYVDQALQAGAWGYVLKGNPDELLTAIRQVLGGEKYLSRILTDKRGLPS